MGQAFDSAALEELVRRAGGVSSSELQTEGLTATEASEAAHDIAAVGRSIQSGLDMVKELNPESVAFRLGVSASFDIMMGFAIFRCGRLEDLGIKVDKRGDKIAESGASESSERTGQAQAPNVSQRPAEQDPDGPSADQITLPVSLPCGQAEKEVSFFDDELGNPIVSATSEYRIAVDENTWASVMLVSPTPDTFADLDAEFYLIARSLRIESSQATLTAGPRTVCRAAVRCRSDRESEPGFRGPATPQTDAGGLAA